MATGRGLYPKLQQDTEVTKHRKERKKKRKAERNTVSEKVRRKTDAENIIRRNTVIGT